MNSLISFLRLVTVNLVTLLADQGHTVPTSLEYVTAFALLLHTYQHFDTYRVVRVDFQIQLTVSISSFHLIYSYDNNVKMKTSAIWFYNVFMKWTETVFYHRQLMNNLVL